MRLLAILSLAGAALLAPACQTTSSNADAMKSVDAVASLPEIRFYVIGDR